MIPKCPQPFTVERARASATLRFSDGTVKHYQSDSDAYLFAACDRIEELEAKLALAEAVCKIASKIERLDLDWVGSKQCDIYDALCAANKALRLAKEKK